MFPLPDSLRYRRRLQATKLLANLPQSPVCEWWRSPSVLARMHAVSQATSFGLGCMLRAVAVAFPTATFLAKVMLILVFIFLTVPTATHLVARAAGYRKGAGGEKWPHRSNQ